MQEDRLTDSPDVPEPTFSNTTIEHNPQVWTESQYSQLKAQIETYKHLYRGLSPPLTLKRSLYPPSLNHWETQRKTYLQTASSIYQYYFKENDFHEFIEKTLKGETHSFTQPLTKEQIADKFKEETQKYYKQNIDNALKRPDLPEEARISLELHKKMLSLEDFQRKLRAKVLGEPAQDNPLDKALKQNLLSRSCYVRPRSTIDKREAKLLEKYEQRMRNWQHEKKQLSRKKFMEELLVHYKEFMDFHKKKQNVLKKRAIGAKAFLDNLKKHVEDGKDKDEAERMKMLEAGEMDKYLEMVNSAKNSRVLEILAQTNKYLEQLGAKVEKQKKENQLFSNEILDQGMIEEVGAGENEKEDVNMLEVGDDNLTESERIKKEIQRGTRMYYALTHTINEEVVEDPKLLKGGKLKNYQLQGLQWLVSLYNNNLNGILADEMGLGKTIQTIALLAYLVEKKNNDGPFLIVVPLSTVTNWDLEFEKWAPKLRRMIYKGDPATRKHLGIQMRHEKSHVVLTTYEYIIKDKSALNRIAWQYIVVDEGHRMKNSKCKFAMVLGQNYQSAHRLLLTGTPLQNNLSELWALLNFLLPKIFAACEDFEKWFNRPFAKMGVEKNVLLNEEERLLIINRLHQVLRPFLLRRMKKEVEQELPNKIEYVIKVDLSGWQKIFYNQLKEHGILAKDPSTGKIGNRSLMNTMMQLRKICNHPYLFLMNYDTEFLRENIWRCSGKFEVLDRILPKLIATGHKVLIFSQMTQLMDIMQVYFLEKKIRHLRLDGSTKVDDRGECTSLFNSEDSPFEVFLLSTRAGGQGLNLQAADTVILFDSDFNPQMDLQAQDRAHRIGQKHEVRVYRLVTSTKVEEEILSRAAMKKNIDNMVIQAGLFNQKASDSERRQKLEDLLRQDEKAQDEEDDSVPDDDQINEFLARSEAELQKYQQMDQERYLEENKEEKTKEIMFKLGLESTPKNFNYRLLQEYEVPEWVTYVPPEQKPDKGKRNSKKVNYSEDAADKALEEIIRDDEPLAMRTRGKKKKVALEETKVENGEESKDQAEAEVEEGKDDENSECLSVDKRMIEIDIKPEDENNKEEEKNNITSQLGKHLLYVFGQVVKQSLGIQVLGTA
eukprot:TRINITY_DN43_c0_g1_i1.p1 TRINITY_DN43_c0_g1~~TRINITY_DN43_c0_g1_i1.p1  ORF type:complete len:1112 (+),score=159.57 TRINITY_DN43_c0_g1_i1:1539-4874(+)